MSNYRKILNDVDLGDQTIVSEWIQHKLKSRKPFKGHRFYINICKIYNNYPNLIEELLDNKVKGFGADDGCEFLDLEKLVYDHTIPLHGFTIECSKNKILIFF